MKTLTVLLITTLLMSPVTWMTDFDYAQTKAIQDNKLMLLNFSGSDWCGPCIRMKKEIFESALFQTYAAEKLVLVRADFPRQKKNQLSQEQTRQNETLAEKYNREGKFPFTVLLDAHGKVLKEWDGFTNESPDDFLSEVNPFVHVQH